MNKPALCLLAAAVALSVVAAAPSRAVSGASTAAQEVTNGRIVFARNAGDGLDDLFSINGAGSGLRRLTNTPGHEAEPDVAPSGRRVAFTSGGGTYESSIGIMTIEGARRRVLDIDLRGGKLSPAWSPDGKRILFVNLRRHAAAEVYSIRPDGTGLRRVTSSKADDVNPVWSPDGDRIAILSTRGSGNFDVWTMSPDGTGARRVTTDATICQTGCEDAIGGFSGMDYAPDGDHLVFAANRGSGTSGIWIVREDGSGLRRLTGGQYPAWSPNGRKIVYSVNGNLFKIRVDGTHRTRLTKSRRDYSPSWGRRPATTRGGASSGAGTCARETAGSRCAPPPRPTGPQTPDRARRPAR